MDVANEPRNTVIYLRVSIGEREKIRKYAADAGMSVAEYARRCMLRSMRGSPLSGLERILLQGIRDKDLETVKGALADVVAFLNDLRKRDNSDSHN